MLNTPESPAQCHGVAPGEVEYGRKTRCSGGLRLYEYFYLFVLLLAAHSGEEVLYKALF